MTRIAALLTCLMLTACVAAESRPPVPVGADFTLAPGESAAIEGASISVRFVAVTDDSRCPTDTTCVWAGEVRVKIEVLEHAKVPRQLEVKPGETTDVAGLPLTLLRVDPQPLSTAKISAQGYRATLRVGRAP